jgi:hypothetical protein
MRPIRVLSLRVSILAILSLAASLAASAAFAEEAAPAKGPVAAPAKEPAPAKATPTGKAVPASEKAAAKEDTQNPGKSTETAAQAAAKSVDKNGTPQRFIPTEQVRADFDVSFPIDM